MAVVEQAPTQSQAGQRNPANLTHGERNLSPIAQLRRMQYVLYADLMDEDTDKRVRALIAQAWERLEERKRVMVGKPAPKPVDTTLAKRKRRPTAPEGPSDPSQV